MKDYTKGGRICEENRQEFVIRAAIEIMAVRSQRIAYDSLSEFAQANAADAWTLAKALLDTMPQSVKDGTL